MSLFSPKTSMSDLAVLAETREMARALSLSSPETSESVPALLARDERERSRSSRQRRATPETSETALLA
jgi:hypothetical protein